MAKLTILNIYLDLNLFLLNFEIFQTFHGILSDHSHSILHYTVYILIFSLIFTDGED